MGSWALAARTALGRRWAVIGVEAVLVAPGLAEDLDAVGVLSEAVDERDAALGNTVPLPCAERQLHLPNGDNYIAPSSAA